MNKLILSLIILLSSCSVAYALEDFTTYTEVDNQPAITVSATDVTSSSFQARKQDGYVYIDKTSIDDLDHDFDVYMTFIQFNASGFVWGISDTIGDIHDFDGADDGIVIESAGGGSAYNLYIRDYSTDTDSTSVPLSQSTQYYLTVTRTGITCTLDVYSDSDRTTLVNDGSVSSTCETDPKQYQYVMGGHNDANASAHQFSITVENLELNDSPATTGVTLNGVSISGSII